MEKKVIWLTVSLVMTAVILLASCAPAATTTPTPASTPTPTPSPTPTAPAQAETPKLPAPSNLPRSDDFSDPMKGLFPDKQHGSGTGARVSAAEQGYPFQWDYGYEGKALVGRIKGDFPEGGQGAFTWKAQAAGKMEQDFAVRVHAQVTVSPGQAGCLIRYDLGTDGYYQFAIFPGVQWYEVRWSQSGPDLANGYASVINVGNADNEMRMEVQGDTLRAYVNGRLLASIQHEGLAKRGGVIQLAGQMVGRLHEQVLGKAPNGEVEVRFTDFVENPL